MLLKSFKRAVGVSVFYIEWKRYLLHVNTWKMLENFSFVSFTVFIINVWCSVLTLSINSPGAEGRCVWLSIVFHDLALCLAESGLY